MGSKKFGGDKSTWIGLDLDGTLATYDGWKGAEHIGHPIPEMVRRLKNLLSLGYTVKLMTARAGLPENIPHIKRWLKEHNLPDLEITNVKDGRMVALYDDRAIGVEKNAGTIHYQVALQHMNIIMGILQEAVYGPEDQLREKLNQALQKVGLAKKDIFAKTLTLLKSK